MDRSPWQIEATFRREGSLWFAELFVWDEARDQRRFIALARGHSWDQVVDEIERRMGGVHDRETQTRTAYEADA